MAKLNISNKMRGYRYRIAVFVLLIAGLLCVVVPIVGVKYGVMTRTTTEMFVSGLGALGTISLATLTFLSILNNRILIEEQLKDRQRPIQKLILESVIDPCLDNVRRNNSRITDGRFYSNKKQIDPNIEINYSGIDSQQEQTPIAKAQLRSNHPEIYNRIVEYDSKVEELEKEFSNVYNELDSVVRGYIRQTENVTAANRDEVILFIMERREPNEFSPEWWRKNSQEFLQKAKSDVPQLDRWYSLVDEFQSFTGDTEELLVDMKRSVHDEYGISLDTE